MLCEHINTCNFILCVSRVMPFTSLAVKAKYCEKSGCGCAIYQEHEVLAIDEETGNLYAGYVMEELEIFEKQYSESYKKLCVRYRATTRIGDADLLNSRRLR
jgi:hypothetical protein